MPDWVKHAIWWQVYPLGFASAEAASEPGGRWRGGRSRTGSGS